MTDTSKNDGVTDTERLDWLLELIEQNEDNRLLQNDCMDEGGNPCAMAWFWEYDVSDATFWRLRGRWRSYATGHAAIDARMRAEAARAALEGK